MEGNDRLAKELDVGDEGKRKQVDGQVLISEVKNVWFPEMRKDRFCWRE